MELQCWSPDFGLPSWDPACLALQTYFSLAGCPVTLKATNNPFWLPRGGDLPIFRHRQVQLQDFESIRQHLESCKFSTDYGLTAKAKAEIRAYSHLVERSLRPAFELAVWVHPKNYVELTRPWYARHLGLPLSYYYPGQYARRALARVQSESGLDEADPEIPHELAYLEKVIHGPAAQCLDSIAERLGEQTYLLGAHPTSLDAIVYAYLAPLLKVPLVATQLPNMVRARPNLEAYVTRITSRFFSRYGEKKPTVDGPEPAADSGTSENPGMEYSTWGNLGAVSTAIVTMGTYGYYAGIFTHVAAWLARRQAL